MLNFLIFRNAQCIKHTNQTLRTEQTHQIILQRYIEFGLPGVSLQLKEEAIKLYETKEAEFPNPEAMREIERVILLKVIDRKYSNKFLRIPKLLFSIFFCADSIAFVNDLCSIS